MSVSLRQDGSPSTSANVSSDELVFLKRPELSASELLERWRHSHSKTSKRRRRMEEQEQLCAYYGKVLAGVFICSRFMS